MKRITTIAAALLMTVSIWAQAPEKMTYQAVIRDVSNNLITNQAIGMQISILQGGATGTAVYVETQTPTTNANGLVSLEIGTGTVISGDFTTIDWANDTYFIKTETDPTGGIVYTITGTTQLMSVPYALHAKTAESITGNVNYTETDPIFGASIANGITATDTANWNNHTIDTQIDSIGIANLGYVAGNHTLQLWDTTSNGAIYNTSLGNAITIDSAGIVQDPWQNLTLQNGWFFYGSSYEFPQFYKDKEGVVHIKGLIKDGNSVNGTVLFTLPTGYPPQERMIFLSYSNSGIKRVDVLSSGDVILYGNSTSSSYLELNSISFRTN